MSKSSETDRLVNEFLEQIVARDASGNVVSVALSFKEVNAVLADARSPTVPDGLRESLHAVAERASNVDPGFESELRTRYLALPDAIRHGASEAHEQRLAELSDLDKQKELACRPDYYPTEATLVAKMYLDGRPITRRDAGYVRNLLEIAAEHGNAEAAYLLATAEVPETLDGDRLATRFLTPSEYLRNQYLRQSRAGNFRKVFEDEANAQYHADDSNEDRLSYLQERLKRDKACEEIAATLEEAEIASPIEQMAAGEALLKRAKYIEKNHERRWMHCRSTRDQVNQLRTRAEHWLRRAAAHEAGARFLVAENFCESDEERFSLLKSAAFPEDGAPGYFEAASPLACEFLMNPTSEYFDAAAGERCIREYLAEDKDYPFLDDGDAANCLADWLLALPAPTAAQKVEAFSWYRRVAVPELGPGSPYALLRVGLMALRGEGCEQDHDLADKYFRKARCPSTGQARDRRASQYADIVLRLGWERWRFVAEELFELAEETEFRGDPLCPLTPEDVSILVARNPHFRPRSSDDELRAFRGRLDLPIGPFGGLPIHHLIVEGLVWVLQPSRQIPRERLAALWGDSSSMIESYAKSRLELTIPPRITPPDLSTLDARVNGLLENVVSLANSMVDDKNREPLKFGDQELVLRVSRQARATLDSLKEIQRIENLAKHKVDVLNKVAKERASILDALSHTLHNSLGTGPEIVRSAVRILGAKSSGLTRLEAGAVNDLTALFTTFEFTEQLIQSFKLQVGDPDKLLAEVMKDEPDLPSLGNVIVHGLRQVVARAMFNDTYLKRAFHLAGSQDNKVLIGLRADFRERVISGEGEAGVGNLLEWIRTHLPGLRVSIAPEAFRYPLHNKMQHSLIFAVVSELLLNALRHADEHQPIAVMLSAKGGATSFSVRNAFVGTAGMAAIKFGSGGLSFIAKLADRLSVPGFFEADFHWVLENGAFQTVLTLTDERMHRNEYRMD